MARPTRVYIDHTALLHNVNKVKQYAPGKKIIAMVKANAYGCGLNSVIPVLEGQVDAFGVACIEEAVMVRSLGSRTDCVLFQGIFSKDELQRMIDLNLQCVVHNEAQLRWILSTPLSKTIKIWVKIDTGMHRLGFSVDEASTVIAQLSDCPWVDKEMILMTHLACADERDNPSNYAQLKQFQALPFAAMMPCSIANSAAIVAFNDAHGDLVRPGLMLYGISPFADQTGVDLGLLPAMRFMSVVSTIHHYPPNSPIGYGGTWRSDQPAKIGVVPVGYGDGYPRHIANHTPTFVNGSIAPIVGRVSMDMLTIDLSACDNVQVGDPVELWGKHIPVETIAKLSGTIAYELICQLSSTVRF